MSENAHPLPSDIETLDALLAAARTERDAALAERDHALSQIDRLRHLLRQLQRAQFGKRSEKLDPEQLLLALEDIEQAIAGNEARARITRTEIVKRGFWSEVQRVYENCIWTSLPSSLRIAWNGVLKPRHFLGVRLAVRMISWISSSDTLSMSI